MPEKKMGRPIKGKEPKTESLQLRITKTTAEQLRECAERLEISRRNKNRVLAALTSKPTLYPNRTRKSGKSIIPRFRVLHKR